MQIYIILQIVSAERILKFLVSLVRFAVVTYPTFLIFLVPYRDTV
jgi:hypothetical protein